MGKSDSPALLQGTLDLLILHALGRGPAHGYQIAQTIHVLSDQVLKVEEGSLYPALYRLELDGAIRGSWGTSDNNRRAKYTNHAARPEAGGHGTGELGPPVGGRLESPRPMIRRLLLKLLRRRRLHDDCEAELAFHREMAAANGRPAALGNTTRAVRPRSICGGSPPSRTSGATWFMRRGGSPGLRAGRKRHAVARPGNRCQHGDSRSAWSFS